VVGSVPFRKKRVNRSEGEDAAPTPGAVGSYLDATTPAAGGDEEREHGEGRGSLAHLIGRGAKSGLTVLTEWLIDVAPRIPVRDVETLRRHFPGLGPEEIADKLVAAATVGTATVGAGIGAAAMLPVPLAMTAELATETLAVAAVEFKLIAELHEVYGVRAPGGLMERTAAYLGAWTQQRGIEVTRASSVSIAFSTQMKRELRQKLVKRTARHLPTLTPFMVGATIGVIVNRRGTRKLAQQVRHDLRARQIPWDVPPRDVPPASQGHLPPKAGEGGYPSPGEIDSP